MKQKIKIVIICLVLVFTFFMSGCNDCGSNPNCLIHDGAARSYLLQVPACYRRYSGDPIPLVVDLHGYTYSGSSQSDLSGFKKLSESECFIVAWPNGLYNSWNTGGGCCGDAAANDVDDVGAIIAIVDQLKSRYNIDPNRVYATGLSNGGAMSHWLNTWASDVFAAVVPYACPPLEDPKTQAVNPNSVLIFQAYDDTLVPYNGGGIGSFVSAEAGFENWKQANGCVGEPVETWRSGDSNCKAYTNCDDGTEVVLCSVPGDHYIYDNISTSITQMGWDFMSRFTLP